MTGSQGIVLGFPGKFIEIDVRPSLPALDGGLPDGTAGSSCDQVTGSRWSLLLGFLPVSSLAIGAYLAQLLCVIYLLRNDDPLEFSCPLSKDNYYFAVRALSPQGHPGLPAVAR